MAIAVGLAHGGQPVRVIGQIIHLHPIVPDIGEMPVGIVDVAVRQPHMQGGPGLDAGIANAFANQVWLQVGEQRHEIHGPVAGGVVVDVILDQLLQIRRVVRVHQKFHIGGRVGVDVGSELAADIQLAPGLQPLIETAEGAQVIEDGGGIQRRQLGIQLQAKGVPDRMAAAQRTRLPQPDAESLDLVELGQGHGWADDFERHDPFRRRIDQIARHVRERGQRFGEIRVAKIQLLHRCRVQFHHEVAKPSADLVFVAGLLPGGRVEECRHDADEFGIGDAGQFYFHPNPSFVTLRGAGLAGLQECGLLERRGFLCDCHVASVKTAITG